MNNNTCRQLLNIETISVAFKSKQPDMSNKIISCFYSCYRSLFVKWAKITYRHYPDDTIEFAADNSFTDAVLKFRESASRGELYHGNAGVKTILFQYCKNILLGHLTHEKRMAEKNKRLIPLMSDQMTCNIGETGNEIKERRHKNVMRALAKMSAADRRIIRWRHIEEKSNDEIAGLLAITVASATNRVYRCMQRLRELVEEMEKE